MPTANKCSNTLTPREHKIKVKLITKSDKPPPRLPAVPAELTHWIPEYATAVEHREWASHLQPSVGCVHSQWQNLPMSTALIS